MRVSEVSEPCRCFRQRGRDAALAGLRAAYARHPYDVDILGALVSMNREAGKSSDALAYARKLAEVLPGDPGVKKLVAELEGGR